MMRTMLTLAAAAILAACNQTGDTVTLPAGEVTELVVIDERTGDGDPAQPGMTAVVHYTGWLYEPAADDRRGRKFDSSRDRGTPFAFPLGAGRVIRGWDEGVAGMQIGGRRLLFIPPGMAYGDRGAGNVIPPGATLVFDVELIELRDDRR